MFGRATITLGIGPHSSSISFNSVLQVHFICTIKNFLLATSFPPSPLYFCFFMTLLVPSFLPIFPPSPINPYGAQLGDCSKSPVGPDRARWKSAFLCILRLVNQSINIRLLRHDKTQANNIMMQPATII